MYLAEFLQICSACTGVIGALFFAIGVIRQTVDAMGALSGTYFDANPHMPRSLAAQKADYIFGGGFIVLTFMLQLASFFVPAYTIMFPSYDAQFIRWFMVSVTFVAFPSLKYLSSLLGKHYTRQIWTWLKQQEEARRPKN